MMQKLQKRLHGKKIGEEGKTLIKQRKENGEIYDDNE